MISRPLTRLAFNAEMRRRTWKKLAAQIHNGIPLDDALGILHDQALRRGSPSAAAYAIVRKHMGSGHSLGMALTGFASPEEIALIDAGQKAGRLDEGLRLATDVLTTRKAILHAVTSALAYPLLLLALCFTVLLVASIKIVPQLALLSNPEQWTGAARNMYVLASFVNSPLGFISFALLLCLALAVFFTLPLWTGAWRLWLERIPPWSLYRLTVGSAWLFTLSTLMRSGMQVSQIFDSMLQSDSTTPYLHERISAIARCARSGSNFGMALYESGMGFPDAAIVDDIRVYATLPNFQSRLHELAKEWMADGVELIQRNARIMNIVFLLLIIGQVMGLALAGASLQTQLIG